MESNLDIPKSDGALVLTAYGVAEFGGRLLCALFAGKASFSLTYIYAGASCFAGVATLLVPFGTSLPALYSYAIGKKHSVHFFPCLKTDIPNAFSK